ISARSRTRVVGHPLRRIDGAAKVTGQTRFADDLVLPRMLHCKLLRSKVAHARILCIDVSAALSAPGVVAVAALDEDAAFDALDLIRVEYEPLPPVASIEEGLAPAPGGVPIHDYGDSGN